MYRDISVSYAIENADNNPRVEEDISCCQVHIRATGRDVLGNEGKAVKLTEKDVRDANEHKHKN